MKLVYKFKIQKNNKLKELCIASNNLYNQANYIILNELEKNHKWIKYYELNSIMQETSNLDGEINYYNLKVQTSQQILKLLDKNWTSYFKSIKDWNKNPNKYKGMPKVPKFRKKNSENLLIFTNQNCQIKNNFLILSKEIQIKIPKYKEKDFKKFQQVRILPKNFGYEIEIIYNQEILNSKLDKNKFASIDLGLDNLVTLISTETQSIIFNGKILKSYNQYYNKRKSFLCSVKDKMKIKNYTKQLYEIEEKRNDYLKDYLHKISKKIIQYLIQNEIQTLVIGRNNSWKDSINLGKKTNQNFVNIPHSLLLSFIKYKCELVGIKVIETEESYTSKCDSLALEKICKHDQYLGTRIKRGLFQSSIGKLINADVNGALNILRKVVDDSVAKQIIDSGFLLNPIKVRNMFSTPLLSF
jgi:putative transposase